MIVDCSVSADLFKLFYCPAIHELLLEILLQALRIMRKLQQDFQWDNALIKPVAMESISISTGTEPALTSQDNSWVGEGNILRRKLMQECEVVFLVWVYGNIERIYRY